MNKKIRVILFASILVITAICIAVGVFLNSNRYIHIVRGEVIACSSDSIVVQVDEFSYPQAFYVFTIREDTIVKNISGADMSFNEIEPNMTVEVEHPSKKYGYEERCDIVSSSIKVNPT